MVFGQLLLSQSSHTYRYNTKNTAPLLKTTEVTGSILHSFATLTFLEQFITNTDDFYEIFINPPEGCVIYGIKGKFEDKVTEFVIHKLIEPVSSGYYDSNSNSDAINLTLGKIPSNTIVTIEITCTFTAILSSPNSFTFNFPAESKLLNTPFTADIILVDSQKIPSKIKLSEGSINSKDGHLILPTIQLTKSFTMTFEFTDPIETTAFSIKNDHFNYIGLSIHPKPLDYRNTLKQEIYLLIDCSGSMKGSKIRSAQAALINFLKALPSNCYFNIFRFGSTFEQMFEHSVENNEKNLQESLNFASKLSADLGGTDIYSPLMSIISETPKKGFVRQVFALTDGEVEYPANVLSICTANRNIMRIFPFGIGSDVNHAFLNELAKSTIGEANFVAKSGNISSDEISEAVLSTLKSSQVAAVVNCQIHIEGVDSFEIAPYPIPSLFENHLTHVIVRCGDEESDELPSLMIEGECGDSPYEEVVNVVGCVANIDLKKLFAYHNIRDLEDRLINTRREEVANIIKENVVRLSIQSDVVSSFTGMFTVINGVEQKPEDLQREMETYQRELLDKHQQKIQQQIQQQQNLPIQQQQIQQQQNLPIQQQQTPIQQQQNLPIQQQQTPIQQQQIQIQQQRPPLQIQKQTRQQRFSVYQIPMQNPTQMPMRHLSQQRLSQKQSRNQQAFSQVRVPVQQSKRSWGSSQSHHQQSSFINLGKQNKEGDDDFVSDLLRMQKPDGSWNDVSLINLLVNLNSQDPKISDLFDEFPSIRNKMDRLSDACIITLIVVGWLLSERKEKKDLFEKEARKGIAYVRAKSNLDISDQISESAHFTDGVSWKSNT